MPLLRHNGLYYKKHNTGATLFELMAVVAVIGILTTIALPSYQSFIDGARVREFIAGLHSAMATARSEAVKRNVAVDVYVPGGAFASGWCVVPSGTTSCTGSNVITKFDGAASSLSLTGGFTSITFQSNGTRFSPGNAPPATVTVTACGTSGKTSQLQVTAAGQISSESLSACP